MTKLGQNPKIQYPSWYAVYYPNTITSADIAGGGINDAGDFAAGVVDSTALADTIAIPTSLTVGGGAATATTFIKLVQFTTDDAGADAIETIADTDVTAATVIVFALDNDLAVQGVVDNVQPGVGFDIQFSANVTNGVTGQYILIK